VDSGPVAHDDLPGDLDRHTGDLRLKRHAAASTTAAESTTTNALLL